MYFLGKRAALAAGLFGLCACDDSEPNPQSADYVSAYAGLDAGSPTVRPPSAPTPVRDASAPPPGRAQLPGAADDAGASESVRDAAVLVSGSDAGATETTVGGELPSAPTDAGVEAVIDAATSSPATDAGNAPVDGGRARADAGPAAPQVFTIRFKAVVAARDFACGQNYDGVGSTNATVRPRDFHFFVESVRLINAQGVEVPLQIATRLPFQEQGVALIDFENNTGGCSGTPERNSEITGTAPADDYRGIVFVNGVPDALNHVAPAMAPAPLRLAGRDWSPLGGYPFIAAELARPDEQPGFAVLHSGSVDCIEQGAKVSCGRENRTQIRLANFNPTRNAVIADLDALFSPIDLTAETSCNGGGDACARLYPQLGIDPASGQPTAPQQLYRVGQ